MFTLALRTGNAAFNGDDGNFDRYNASRQMKDIFKQIVCKIENGYDSGKCMDINGNCVGEWKLDV